MTAIVETKAKEFRLLTIPSAACAVREATTGRVVAMLPRVWAVGVDRSVQRTGGSVPGDSGRPAPIGAEDADAGVADPEMPEAREEVAFYRKYTEAMLRRYQRMRLSTPRVPSPMDREMFRGRMSHYKVQGFDDAVIFCADVEMCLARLNGEDQRMLRRIAVQEYSLPEAAGLLGMSLRSCIVLYRRALDRTTKLFLKARLLEPQKSCQEARPA